MPSIGRQLETRLHSCNRVSIFNGRNLLAEGDLGQLDYSGSCPDESEIADTAGLPPFSKVSRQ